MARIGSTLIAVLLLTSASAAQWPQWRGPNRDGKVAAEHVPASWPAKLTPKIIENGFLIVHGGDDSDGAFYALDPLTGAERWTLPGHGPGYASPVAWGIISASRVPESQIITMTDKAVVGVHTKTGKLLWQIPFPDEWNENIVTPVWGNDNIVIVSGTRNGTFGYRVQPSGEWTTTQVWHNADVPMYMSSPVLDGDFVYGFTSRRKGQIFCLEASTGKVRWATEGRAGGNASLQIAGPNLIVLTTEGELLVVKKSPERHEELHRYKVADSGTWAQPVVLKDGILVRDAQSLSLLGL